MAPRTIAIGDIHGCSDALAALMEAVRPTAEDTMVFLGDFIDRGADSHKVIDQVIRQEHVCNVIPILGNHEELLLEAIAEPSKRQRWLELGGVQTLKSYGWRTGERRTLAGWFPDSHLKFFNRCQSIHETETHFFTHAGYEPHLPLNNQKPLALRRRVTDASNAVPHNSGKIAVVGHTPQYSGEVLALGFLVCIDTNCVRGGWLTAMDVDSGKCWQVDRFGRTRSK